MTAPQIVSLDLAGRHNASLYESATRVMASGQWKRQRVVVILPASNSMSTKVALSHWNLIFPPNNGVARILAVGMEVGEAYSQAIEQVLAHPDLGQWEFVLCIEHDNAPPPDAVLKLLKRMDAHPEMSAISGLYWTKGFEHAAPQIWGDVNDPVLNFRPQPPRVGELVECCGIGMGLSLFRMSMFRDEKLRRPWFKTGRSIEDGISTQDLYFWSDARKHGHRCAVDCDVLVGHYDAATDMMY